MGIILSRFRKKKTRIETLEELENDIKEMEESRTYAQMRYKRITKLLLVYSLGLYVLCGIFFYFQFTSTLKGKLLYLVPLALSPLVLYLVNKLISWYYVRKINKNQSRLNEMKKEKKRILDEVMDKETYKVAKEILEKFSAESLPKPNLSLQRAPVPVGEDRLRKRLVNVSNTPNPQTSRNMMSVVPANRSLNSSLPHNKSFQAPGTPMMRLPAPVPSLDRSYVDKVFEYLIGDGPNNRYALICSQCHSHNGMALKEEFEYIGYKCCYCFFYNPARKLRPEAPKLESFNNESRERDSDSESKTSGENSDGEYKADVRNIEALDDKPFNQKEDLETPQSPKAEEDLGLDNTNTSESELNDELQDNENITSDKILKSGELQAEESLVDKLSGEDNKNSPENYANCDQTLLKS